MQPVHADWANETFVGFGDPVDPASAAATAGITNLYFPPHQHGNLQLSFAPAGVSARAGESARALGAAASFHVPPYAPHPALDLTTSGGGAAAVADATTTMMMTTTAGGNAANATLVVGSSSVVGLHGGNATMPNALHTAGSFAAATHSAFAASMLGSSLPVGSHVPHDASTLSNSSKAIIGGIGGAASAAAAAAASIAAAASVPPSGAVAAMVTRNQRRNTKLVGGTIDGSVSLVTAAGQRQQETLHVPCVVRLYRIPIAAAGSSTFESLRANIERVLTSGGGGGGRSGAAAAASPSLTSPPHGGPIAFDGSVLVGSRLLNSTTFALNLSTTTVSGPGGGAAAASSPLIFDAAANGLRSLPVLGVSFERLGDGGGVVARENPLSLGDESDDDASVSQPPPSSLLVSVAHPKIPQGNIRDVLAEWVAAHDPTPAVREAVIRAILFAVLTQLRALHARGEAHGAVKATNVFAAAHVTEALRATGLMPVAAAAAANAAAVLSPGPSLSGLAATASLADTQRSGGGGTAAASSLAVPLEHRRTMSTLSNATAYVSSGAAATATAAAGGGAPSSNDVGVGGVGAEESTPLFLQQAGQQSSDQISQSPKTAGLPAAAPAADATAGLSGPAAALRRAGPYADGTTAGVPPDLPAWLGDVVLADGLYCPLERLFMPPELTVSQSSPLASVSSTSSLLPMSELRHFAIETMEYVPPPEHIAMSAPTSSAAGAAGSDGSGAPALLRTTTMQSATRTFVSPAADVWAIGLLAIQLADGAFPSWLFKQAHPLPSLRRGRWSNRFASFVQRCVRLDPQRRPDVAALLADDWFQATITAPPTLVMAMAGGGGGAAVAAAVAAARRNRGGRGGLSAAAGAAGGDDAAALQQGATSQSPTTAQSPDGRSTGGGGGGTSGGAASAANTAVVATLHPPSALLGLPSGPTGGESGDPSAVRRSTAATASSAAQHRHYLATLLASSSAGASAAPEQIRRRQYLRSHMEMLNELSEHFHHHSSSNAKQPAAEVRASPQSEQQQSRTSTAAAADPAERAHLVNDVVDVDDEQPPPVSPIFLGAFIGALEICRAQLVAGGDAALADPLDSGYDDSPAAAAMTDVLQAFLALQAASPMAADAWCLSLLQQMRANGDDEIAGAVEPLFASLAASSSSNAASAMAATGGGATTSPSVAAAAGQKRAQGDALKFDDAARARGGAAAANAAAVDGPSGGGSGGDSLAGRKTDAGAMAKEPSPADFNSFLFCKWHAITQYTIAEKLGASSHLYGHHHQSRARHE